MTNEDMETKNTIEIKAANGFTYKFVEFCGHVITYYWDKNFEDWRQNCRTFENFDEAIAWADHFGKYEPRNTELTPGYLKAFEVPDDYYGVPGRYYGD